MVRYTTIEDYIRDLKRELREVDEAIISDAIDDTEEHLGLKVQELMEEGGAKLKEEAVARAVADFGTPSEVARAYLEMNDELKGKEEKRQKKKEKRSLFCDIFCIYGD
ncbi:MAG: hypothetical protein JXA22_09110, partial [Candidatus Thermoplasmatota archaeon]|nr:hypothetical protein [Candidatus Thermoplasmatota archaeon]